MDLLLKKMNYKDESKMLCVNIPKELSEKFNTFKETIDYKTSYKDLDSIPFTIIFVFTQAEIDEMIANIKDKLTEDVKLWFCYPKKSSKKYKCKIDRDHGWESLGEIGFEPVRQVSVNNDFSALRFRRVEKIKTITRSKEMVLSSEAKERTTDVTARKKK